MTPKQYREIKRALKRFQDLVTLDLKQVVYNNTDRVVVNRALVDLQDALTESRKGKTISDCLDCPWRE